MEECKSEKKDMGNGNSESTEKEDFFDSCRRILMS